jgi:hypothetical protein
MVTSLSVLAESVTAQQFALDGDVLVVSEVKEVQRIAGIPAGLTAQEAGLLMFSQDASPIAKQERDQSSLHPAFLVLLYDQNTVSGRVFDYQAGQWSVETFSSASKAFSLSAMLTFQLFPFLFFCIIGLSNTVSEYSKKRLFHFNITFLALVISIIFSGFFIGSGVVSLVVFVLGLVINGLTLSRTSKYLYITLIGLCLCASTAGGVYSIATASGWQLAMVYVGQLIGIMAIAYFISGAISRKFPQLVENLRRPCVEVL